MAALGQGPGASAPPAALEQRFGDSPQEHFGWSVASASDFDGDGRDDWMVGAPCDLQRGPLSGSVKVFTGSPAVERLNLQGFAPGDLFGSALARVPDVDCDGVDDILVGAPGASARGRSSGEAFIFSGVDARILFRYQGDREGDLFGSSVCSLGDLDGDGRAEIAIGAPGARTWGRDSGMVRVYDGADARIVYTFTGDARGERFGACLAAPGDMDGDGVPELAVGAPCPRLDRPGYVRVLAGRDASVLYTLGGLSTWELFGSSLAALGDVDGDGRGDLVVGSPGAHPGPVDATIYPGHASGAATLFGGNGVARLRWTSAESEDRFGSALCAIPDIDGDGAADLVVSATQRWRPLPGAVFAYSSRDGRLLETWCGAVNGEQFGSAVTVLPAANGGFDLCIGSPNDPTRGAAVGSALRVRSGRQSQ